MRKIAMTAAGIAAAVIGTGVALAPTANAATTGTATACPSGAVCLQEPNGSILSKNIWYSYGAHNLQNVTGYKVLRKDHAKTSPNATTTPSPGATASAGATP